MNGAPELTVHVDESRPGGCRGRDRSGRDRWRINDGTLMAGEAIAMVIIRLYGSDGAVATA